MPGATPSYPPEFKRGAVRLVRSSPNRSIAQIAKELGVSDNSLRSWVKQTEIDFVASLKTELLHGHRFLSREAARMAIFDYVEGFYNRIRRHSSLGYLSPSEYEQATMEATKEVAVA